MKERNKKIILWTSLGLIISTSAALATTFVVLQNKKNQNSDPEKNENHEEKSNNNNTNNSEINHLDKNTDSNDNLLDNQTKKELNWKEIFPEIKSSDYYNKLNYKDGQAWIDEDMIVYIIKDILNRMLVTNGEVRYAYKKVDDQNLIITFKWNNEKEKSVVTYKISANKL